MKFAIFEGALTGNHSTVVSEVVEAPRTVEGVEHALTDLYHPALVATMRRCPEGVAAGHIYDVVTDTYREPVSVALDGDNETDTGNGNPPPN